MCDWTGAKASEAGNGRALEQGKNRNRLDGEEIFMYTHGMWVCFVQLQDRRQSSRMHHLMQAFIDRFPS
jgi:hypothetical protein